MMVTGKPVTRNQVQAKNSQEPRKQQVGLRVLTVTTLSASCAP